MVCPLLKSHQLIQDGLIMFYCNFRTHITITLNILAQIISIEAYLYEFACHRGNESILRIKLIIYNRKEIPRRRYISDLLELQHSFRRSILPTDKHFVYLIRRTILTTHTHPLPILIPKPNQR